MNFPRARIAWLVPLVWILAVGCGPRPKPVTERDRKEAALLVTEAEFALTLRDWGRAEGLLTRAAQLAPTGDIWRTLGSTRVRQGNREAAREAYGAAVKAYKDDAAREGAQADAWLKQVVVLAALGRLDESRAVLAAAAKRFPADANVRALGEPRNFEQMLASPQFKETAL